MQTWEAEDEADAGDWYLWKRHSLVSYPWLRQYIDRDFLRSEVRQVRAAGEWFQQRYLRAVDGNLLPEVTLYAVEASIAPGIRAYLKEFPELRPVGLSSLPNT